ncbi:beta-galactosidase [Mucilaginibacter rubeus]|uniref:Beta-galactosidase n=1 Tax=Mucilaginibacter rubeus TaxID=2027860 RepID=A0AAE6JE44_9SPHI|nr:MULTISPECIES: beta-galactosidase [Mucilaginibacter]QEM04019.1 beta-galactosidase [Mucilaginibacter rubeus]QEM16625.1 beta-galactosidase [Mucilaginibacter gossypii]QTE46906.1 beta-galactosidase [Mucilaginibacter rubeus]QTE53504.1 beta-galactosidase [Mucilaginibacter rubeus]QTE58590.1 beta-galactosidase [Mucilaginibacter rubeus]
MKKTLLSLLLLTLIISQVFSQAKHSFKIADGNFIYDGKPIQIHSGEMHFARIPKAYWKQRLQMLRAMGMNAVATYVFWNHHEVSPGVWDFKTDNRDIREFVKTAQQEGLMVILRPGPYACAEWEFGGYPWWLQNDKQLVIRSKNDRFLDSCKTYINQLMGQVKDLQITHGGPIIMVQAENEFGSYVAQRKDVPLADHKIYSAAVKDLLLKAGVDVPLFTSDGDWLFEGGVIKGALPTANGEGDTKNLKKLINQYNGGKGPYMVAEYYPGWLDHWGEKFEKVSETSVIKDLEKYLKDTVSFNIYMAHGGTNFGFTNGANYDKEHQIQPDITSYDYDAPISEAGWVTPKFTAIRNLMKKYAAYAIPEVPAQLPVIQIPAIKLTKTADLLEMAKDQPAVESDTPQTFETLKQGHGYVLYSRKFTQPVSGTLNLEGLRDYATIYVNGEKVAELNRQSNKFSCPINIPFNARLDILVENLGRINYGGEIIHNLKGIISPVKVDDHEITGNWQMYKLPMDKIPALGAGVTNTAGHPALYQGTFDLNKVGDTFLEMKNWGKGIVFVNGINIGRYWKIGPQQTLYLPGCWLKKGTNSIVVLDQLNDIQQTEITTVTVPVLDGPVSK